MTFSHDGNSNPNRDGNRVASFDQEPRVEAAFGDLQRRAAHVAIDGGPHRVSADGGGNGDRNRRLIPALAVAAIVAIAAASAWQLRPSDSINTDTTDIAEDGGGASDGSTLTETDSEGSASLAEDEGTFDRVTGTPSDIYVLTGDFDSGSSASMTVGTLVPGPDSSSTQRSKVLLPSFTTAAAFDGVGGAIHTSTDEVWLMNPSGESRRLAVYLPPAQGQADTDGDGDAAVSPAADGEAALSLASIGRLTGPPILVGERTVNGRHTVLVLAGNLLLGYRADGSHVALELSRFDGPVRRVDMAGSTVVALVGEDREPSSDTDSTETEMVHVSVWSMADDSIRPVTEPLPADDPMAPREVGLSSPQGVDDPDLSELRLVMLTNNELQVRSLRSEDQPVVSLEVDLPVPYDVVADRPYDDPSATTERGMTLDVSGQRALLGFGESATVVNLRDGTSGPFGLPDGWVRSAHWSEGLPVEQPAPVGIAELTAGDRLRVASEAVRADADDPFLNVREEADAASTLVAKLPPNYRGLRATGRTETADDGAAWIEVELMQPVAWSGSDPESSNPTGWINGAYATAIQDRLGVGVDEIEGCGRGGDGVNNSVVGGRLSEPAWVYGLESGFIYDDCLRVVVTFAPGANYYRWSEVAIGTGPAAALPQVRVVGSGAGGVTVDLGAVTTAWPDATETADGVYVVRSGGPRSTLQLVSPLPVQAVNVAALPEFGVAVVDLTVTGMDAPTADRLVALDGEPVVGAGSVVVNGLARPFEASLGVSIVDADGNDVEIVYSGSADLGTIRSDQYAVSTTDWTEAWGRFSVQADGLAPGDYTMLLDAEGGSDTPSPLRVPFTVTDGPVDDPGDGLVSDEEQAAAQALVNFARGGNVSVVPLADRVTLTLGTGADTNPDAARSLSSADAADRSRWVLDSEVFAGRVGPFDLLQMVESGRVRYSRGPINNCASPPLDWPSEWDSLTQVNIEPVGIDSCIDWFALTLFLDDTGDIGVVTLSMVEP